jgi:hypothetical protein
MKEYENKKCSKCNQSAEQKLYTGIPSILNLESNTEIKTKLMYSVGCGCKESVIRFDSDIYPTLESAIRKWRELNLDNLK